jgi:hypothetical protein
VSYSADAGHTKGMMSSLSANVASYRGSGKGTMENLYDQATYNASTGDSLGGNNPLGGQQTIVGGVAAVIPSLVVGPDGKPLVTQTPPDSSQS